MKICSQHETGLSWSHCRLLRDSASSEPGIGGGQALNDSVRRFRSPVRRGSNIIELLLPQRLATYRLTEAKQFKEQMPVTL